MEDNLEMYEFRSSCVEFYKQINVVDSFNDSVKATLNQYEDIIEYIKFLVSQNDFVDLKLVREKNILKLNKIIGKSSRELFSVKMVSNLDMKVLYEVLKLEFCDNFYIGYKNELEKLHVSFLRVYLSDNVNIVFDGSIIYDSWILGEQNKVERKIDFEKIKR